MQDDGGIVQRTAPEPSAQLMGGSDGVERQVSGTTRTVHFEGTLQSVDAASRHVTILLDDGKVLVKVGIGSTAGDLGVLQPRSRLAFTLRESVHFSVDHSPPPQGLQNAGRPRSGSSDDRKAATSHFSRPPAGHHDLYWAETIDVRATVVAVDPAARRVELMTADGRQVTVNVSDSSLNLADLKDGERGVASFREVHEVDVVD